MSEAFDPYRKWLGIPPSEQPPNHYRLLGLALYEDDTDTIHHAADRQMAHLRTFQSGKFATQSQTLLNEVSTARLCLLDPAKKTAYDEKLKQELAPPTATAAAPPSSPPAAVAPPPPSPDDGPPPVAPPGNLPQGTPVAVRAVGTGTSDHAPAPTGPVVKTSSRPRGGSYAARRKKSSPMPMIIGILGVGGLVVIGLLIAVMSGNSKPTVVTPPVVPPRSTPQTRQPVPSTNQQRASNEPTPRPRQRTRPRTETPQPSLPPPATTQVADPPSATPSAPVNNRDLTMAEIDARQVTTSIKEVRAKLGDRNLEAAKRILDGLEISVKNANMEAEYEHELVLYDYLDRFISQGLRRAARNRMMPGDSFEFRGDRVELISRDDDNRQVTYKFNGTEATHEIDKIPTKPAIVFAWQSFERENIDPFSYISTATFLMFDANSELPEAERLEMAKAYWQEAIDAGTTETYLAKELGLAGNNGNAAAPIDANSTDEDPMPAPANPASVADSASQSPAELPPNDEIETERFQLAKSIRDKYGRAIPPAAKQEVIDLLLTQIAETPEAARKYVMYEKAVELTCELREASRLGELLTQWSEAQGIDYLEQLAIYLPRCRPATESEATPFLTLAEEGYQSAATDQRFDQALKLADLALKAAAFVKNMDLVQKIRSDIDSIEEQKSGATEAVGSAL